LMISPAQGAYAHSSELTCLRSQYWFLVLTRGTRFTIPTFERIHESITHNLYN